MFVWEEELKIAGSLFDILSPKNRPELSESCTAVANVPIHKYYKNWQLNTTNYKHINSFGKFHNSQTSQNTVEKNLARLLVLVVKENTSPTIFEGKHSIAINLLKEKIESFLSPSPICFITLCPLAQFFTPRYCAENHRNPTTRMRNSWSYSSSVRPSQTNLDLAGDTLRPLVEKRIDTSFPWGPIVVLLKVEELVREEIQLKLILSARLGLRPRVNIWGYTLVQTPKSKPTPWLIPGRNIFGWEALLSTADSRDFESVNLHLSLTNIELNTT